MDKSVGLRCDQTIVLNGVRSAHDYPQPLRRIKYHDGQTGKTFNFLTNNFAVPAHSVADLYTILQILSLTLFEKTPLDQLLTNEDIIMQHPDTSNQLSLFDNFPGQ